MVKSPIFGNERACIKPANGLSIGHFYSFILDIPTNDFIFLSDFSQLEFSSSIDVPPGMVSDPEDHGFFWSYMQKDQTA